MIRISKLRPVLLFMSLALLGALVAGCSGTDAVDKQGYIKKNNAIQTEAVGAINKMSPSDPASLDTAAATLDKAVKDLNALEVPEDYAKEHDQMVGALSTQSDLMGELKAAVAAKDAKALGTITPRMTAAQTEFNKAIDAMNADRA